MGSGGGMLLNILLGKGAGLFFFFFSSRRRHTRCGRDWSPDVCSSDLEPDPDIVRGKHMRAFAKLVEERQLVRELRIDVGIWLVAAGRHIVIVDGQRIAETGRSEERRVGKECRWRWGTEHEKKKERQG